MREVLLTGSVPLRPASAVFEALGKHLGDVAPFYPDGEQGGWVVATKAAFAQSPSLEALHDLRVIETAPFKHTFYRIKPGLKGKDFVLGSLGIATNAIASYQDFKRLRDAGIVPAGTRFQVTVPGVGMLMAQVNMLPQESFPVGAAAILREIREVLEVIPASDLVIQLDLPNETSFEEYERRPWAFNIPYYDVTRLSLDAGVDALASIVNQVPADVPIGLHTCSAWHMDAHADQDNRTIVEIANRYIDAFKRPLRYINIPIHPLQTTPSHFVPFRDLDKKSDTVLSLGLINLADGLEGAKKRIAAAEAAGIYDFGVSFWCGLGSAGYSISEHPFVQQATPDTIGDLLDLHKQVAAL